MSWKKKLSAYFMFSPKERWGVVAVLCLISLIIIIPLLFSKPAKPSELKSTPSLIETVKTQQDSKTNFEENFPDQPKHNNNKGYNNSYSTYKTGFDENAPLFSFNPNTLDEVGWQKLGLQEKTVRTIMNYRQKGGKFYKREDLKKIWGLPEDFYERVEDYIDLPALNTSDRPTFNKSAFYKEQKESRISDIDINNADTSVFIALPGIGSKLANRIINFRDKLGGFYSIGQIGETYGIPDSTFQKIKPHLKVSENAVKTFNINVATKDELKTHPYIRWNLANAIVEYRNQHGNFKNLDDLKNIGAIDEAAFNKIVHYLTL